MPRPTLAQLTWTHLRIGNITFGGGDPAMAALHSELVTRRGWLTDRTYGLVYALARITPGTNVLAFCAGVSWKILGWPAALLAVAAVTLPSAAIVVTLTQGYESLRSNALAMAAIAAVLAAATGMMLAAAWQLVRPHLRGRGTREAYLQAARAAIVVSGAVVLSLGFSMSPIPVLALAAVTGILWRIPATENNVAGKRPR
jgi:chromate transporter